MPSGRAGRPRSSLPAAAPALLVAGLALVPVGGLLLGAAGVAASPAALGSGPAGGLTELLRSGAPRLAANTLLLAVAVTTLSLVAGTALAWLEQRTRYPGRRILATLSLMPLAVPSYLLAGTLREVLGPGGAIGARLGLPAFTGIGPAVLVLTLVCTPYVHVLVGAALVRMSAAEEEAARGLGASGWHSFRAIVLPRLGPALGLGGMLVALYAFGDFGAVAVLDCQVLTWRMFQAYETQNLPRAAVLGLVSLTLLLPFLAASLWAQRRADVSRDAANPRPSPGARLTFGRTLAAFVLHAPVIALGVLVPLWTLAAWIARGAAVDEAFAPLGGPLRQTLVLAGLGAVVILALSVLPAWVSARRGAAWGWLVDHSVYLSGALPGVLVATGLFLVALAAQRTSGLDRAYLGLRQWGVLLFAGYATRYLSQGFSGLKSAFLRLDERQQECARSLGATGPRRWLRVVAPEVAPGAAAAYLLLFLVLIKELPITLVLQPIGVQTLSFRVFDRYQEAFLHDAGLAGIVLVGVALIGQLATLRWRRHA